MLPSGSDTLKSDLRSDSREHGVLRARNSSNCQRPLSSRFSETLMSSSPVNLFFASVYMGPSHEHREGGGEYSLLICDTQSHNPVSETFDLVRSVLLKQFSNVHCIYDGPLSCPAKNNNTTTTRKPHTSRVFGHVASIVDLRLNTELFH